MEEKHTILLAGDLLRLTGPDGIDRYAFIEHAQRVGHQWSLKLTEVPGEQLAGFCLPWPRKEKGEWKKSAS